MELKKNIRRQIISSLHFILIFSTVYDVCILTHCHLLVKTSLSDRQAMALWVQRGIHFLKRGLQRFVAIIKVNHKQ